MTSVARIMCSKWIAIDHWFYLLFLGHCALSLSGIFVRQRVSWISRCLGFFSIQLSNCENFQFVGCLSMRYCWDSPILKLWSYYWNLSVLSVTKMKCILISRQKWCHLFCCSWFYLSFFREWIQFCCLFLI